MTNPTVIVRKKGWISVFFGIDTKNQMIGMMFEYIPVKEDLSSKELGDFSTFGIKVLLVVDEKYEIGVASDVSDDYSTVHRIAKYCNRKQVCPIDLLNTVSLFV